MGEEVGLPSLPDNTPEHFLFPLGEEEDNSAEIQNQALLKPKKKPKLQPDYNTHIKNEGPGLDDTLGCFSIFL